MRVKIKKTGKTFTGADHGRLILALASRMPNTNIGLETLFYDCFAVSGRAEERGGGGEI